MAGYDVILFDLDGTLTDPGEGITRSVAYALERFGIQVADRTVLYPFIGPPLVDSFQKYYGFSDEQAAQAVGWFRAYFRERGIFENRVYAGVGDMLQALQQAGKTLIVATSKPEVFATRIMAYFDLAQYVTYIAGSNLDETRTRKAEVIAYALDACGITDTRGVVMVGDREYDMEGARQNGLDAIGVLYGYGSREELKCAGATHIVTSVEELQSLLLVE